MKHSRTSEKDYITNDAEVQDLIALDQFSRSCCMPVAVESVAWGGPQAR